MSSGFYKYIIFLVLLSVCFGVVAQTPPKFGVGDIVETTGKSQTNGRHGPEYIQDGKNIVCKNMIGGLSGVILKSSGPWQLVFFPEGEWAKACPQKALYGNSFKRVQGSAVWIYGKGYLNILEQQVVNEIKNSDNKFKGDNVDTLGFCNDAIINPGAFLTEIEQLNKKLDLENMKQVVNQVNNPDCSLDGLSAEQITGLLSEDDSRFCRRYNILNAAIKTKGSCSSFYKNLACKQSSWKTKTFEGRVNYIKEFIKSNENSYLLKDKKKISPAAAICIAGQETQYLEPVIVSFGSCRKRGTDTGLGQLTKSTFRHYIEDGKITPKNLKTDPFNKEPFISSPWLLWEALPNSPDLQLELMMITIKDKYRHEKNWTNTFKRYNGNQNIVTLKIGCYADGSVKSAKRVSKNNIAKYGLEHVRQLRGLAQVCNEDGPKYGKVLYSQLYEHRVNSCFKCMSKNGVLSNNDEISKCLGKVGSGKKYVETFLSGCKANK